MALLGLALLPASAQAEQRLMTWDTESRFVDPNQIPGAHYNRPPGTPPRPNALKVNVRLPDGYDAPANAKTRYPVLFLLHGVGDGFDSWAHPAQGDLLEVAKDFPGIVVMPEGDRGFYMDAWNGGRRGDPAWERYHLDELIPLAEQKLRIAPGRSKHAIAGFSMGGQGSAYYAAQRPGYFGAVALSSAYLSIQRPTYQTAFELGSQRKSEELFGDPAAQAFYWEGHNPLALLGNLEHTRVFVAVGDGVPGTFEEAANPAANGAEMDLAEHAREFVQAARGRVRDLAYEPQQGGHFWRYWRRHLAGAIRWGLFEDVPEDPARWRFRTVSQRGAAWDYRFEFEQPPDRVQQLEREGDRLSGNGSGSVHLCAKDGGEISAALPFDQPLPKPSRPAKLALPFPSLDRAAAGGVLRARVKPVSGAGKLRVTATARRPKLGARKAKRVTIAARSIGFREGEAKTVKLRVRASGRRLLRELAGEDGRGAARVRVLARSTDCAGNKRARALTKTLR